MDKNFAIHRRPKDAPPTFEPVEWVPADLSRRARMEELFERPGPFEVDFGCGEGGFLLTQAERFPERNYLGTERLLGRVSNCCRRIARKGLANARILRLESAYATKHLLPAESVVVAHIGFPDPWPKRHHHIRRLVQEAFLESLRAVLAPAGEVRMKTDDLPYFHWMEKVAARVAGFERIDWVEEPDYPRTGFEEHFLAKGLPIHRLRLRKA